MIITDADADTKGQRRPQDVEAQPAGASTSQSQPLLSQPPPAYTPSDYVPQTHPTEEDFAEYRASHAARRRFLHAFAVAAIIWLLLAMLSGSIADLSRLGHSWRSDRNPSKPSSDIGWPIARDGHIESCVRSGAWSAPQSYDSGRLFRKTSFRLPADADELYLLSRGAASHGRLSVREDSSGEKTVRVDVRVIYALEDAMDKATVCLLSRDNAAHGVGIYSPQSWHYNSGLEFEVVLTVPTTAKSIKALFADVPKFTISVADLYAIAFGRLALKTEHAPIQIGAVRATDLVLQTTSAPIQVRDRAEAATARVVTEHGNIRGLFNASRSLVLQTDNAAIDAAVHLYSDGGPRATYFSALTKNGLIDATVHLYNSTVRAPRFATHTNTSNTALRARYDRIPADTVLHAWARTSNARADVALAPAFEGRFRARTTNAQATFKPPTGGADGRSREVRDLRQGGTEVSGRAVWVPTRMREVGSVDVRTSNGPVTLTL